MVYISADGSVGGKKSLWMKISEFFATLFAAIGLFFTTISNPQSLENRPARKKTYAERNGGRSYRGNGSKLGGKANIKGLDQLGDAKCAIGGG